MATKTLLTIEQFEQLPEREEVIYELDEGELTSMARPRLSHNLVRDDLAYHLTGVVRAGRLGRIVVETEFRLAENTVRVPDIAFITTDQMRQIDPGQLVQGAPTLAIEVVSPGDLAEDLARKVEQYIDAGAKAVWVVYLRAREVHIFRASGVVVLRRADAVLEDPEILPGFSLPLATLFE
jgi:Uma2 family endonuclease